MPIDLSLYHPDFPRVSHQLKTERALGQCEFIYPSGNRCQARDWEPHPVTGSMVVLACCHLDHDISHADPEKLAIFCQKHHNQYDAALRSEQQKQRIAMQRAAERAASGQLGLWEGGEGEGEGNEVET